MKFCSGLIALFLGLQLFFLPATWAQQSQHENPQESHAGNDKEEHDDHTFDCGHHGDETEYDAKDKAYHHISDLNVYSIGEFHISLPCILYTPGHGWDLFFSSRFRPGHHGTGSHAYNQFVLDQGMVRRIVDPSFPLGEIAIDCIVHQMEDGREVAYVLYGGHQYRTDAKSTADGGLFGGGITSFYDFSLTKNVISMILVLLFSMWMFLKIARMYRQRDGMAPKGVQSFIEPIFVFIQDEVAKPFLGHKWAKFLPFLMSLFFFILLLNLFGQIPFLGGSNVTGNLAVTMVLAIFAFIVTNINGKKPYWQHVFWMPGVPAWVKSILTPVEILGLFIKPFTLMLRLFANMTAGHIIVLSFVGLIFIFGNVGTNIGGAVTGVVASVPLTIFMMAIELLVAFIQAFVFTILTASYIGAAIEEHH